MNLIHPFSMVINGACKSGKSYLIKYLISTYKNQFDHCIIFSNTAKMNKEYNHLGKLIKLNIFNYNNIEQKLTYFLNAKTVIKDEKILMIFDDIGGGLKLNSNLIFHLFSMYRHYNISVIYSIQYITKCPTVLRELGEYICVFKQNSLNAKKHCHDWYFNDLTMNEYSNMNTKLPQYAFFYIDRSDFSKKNIFRCP